MSRIKMNKFLEQETRRGFVVSEVMKRSWAADLKIMEDIKDICNQHSLRMFACYGTLLGAVREHGYIAWDDDIDIGFVGNDYISFLDIMSKERGDKYNIINPYTKTWYSMNFTHIANCKSPIFNRKWLEEWCGCPFMTGPDVYPYYYIPRNPNEEEYILQVLEKIDYAIALNRQINHEKTAMNFNEMHNEVLAEKLVELQHETGYAFTTDRPMENQLEILYDQVCRITEEKEADYVARYDEYSKNKRHKFPKEYFETTVEFPFENISMPVPIGYDALLKTRFGERFILPKKEASLHGYPYFAKQIDDEEFYEIQLSHGISSGNSINEQSFKENRKSVLYHTSIKELLIHTSKAIKQISDVLNFFSGNEDSFEIYWVPDVLLKTDDYAFDLIAPRLAEEYEILLKRYRENGGKIHLIDRSINELASKCDIYFGDEGVIADICRSLNKTVIVQDYSGTNAEANNELKKFGISLFQRNNEEIATDSNSTVMMDKTCVSIPKEWDRIITRQNGTRKKVMLYVTSISIMYQYQNMILEKIQKVLDTFFDNKEDVALIWRPPVINDNEIKAFGKDFLKGYSELVERFRKDAWGILDETDTPGAAIEIADAVYGDSDMILLECKAMDKPVMIQNPSI